MKGILCESGGRIPSPTIRAKRKRETIPRAIAILAAAAGADAAGSRGRRFLPDAPQSDGRSAGRRSSHHRNCAGSRNARLSHYAVGDACLSQCGKTRDTRNGDSPRRRGRHSNTSPTTSFRTRAQLGFANRCALRWRGVAGPSFWIRWHPAAWPMANAGASMREMDSRTGSVFYALGRSTLIGRNCSRAKRPDRLGWMEEFDYTSSQGLFADGFAQWNEVFSGLNEKLKSVPNVCGGATLLSRGGCMVRFLARSASGYDGGE